jgi:hypothetical protein
MSIRTTRHWVQRKEVCEWSRYLLPLLAALLICCQVSAAIEAQVNRRKPDPPSARYQTYKYPLFAVSVPDNWRESVLRTSTIIGPQGGFQEDANKHLSSVTYAVEFGTIDGKRLSLRQLADEFVRDYIGSNPRIKQQGSYKGTYLSGRDALMATLTEDRVDQTLVEFIYGSLLPNGTLFWLIATVPQSEYSAYQKTFQDILRSVQFHSPQDSTQGTTVEYKGLTYTLNECRLSAGDLTCYLVITSNGRDRNMSAGVDPSGHLSRMFDNVGNEYQIKKMTFANNEDRSTLVADVPTKSTVTFESINREATSISLLELLYYEQDEQRGGPFVFSYTIQFRNILIQR